MKSRSAFHIEQKMAFEKFSCFFVNFLRNSFGRIKVISTMVERDYAPDMTWQGADLLYISIDWFLYDKRFYRTVFPKTIVIF